MCKGVKTIIELYIILYIIYYILIKTHYEEKYD